MIRDTCTGCKRIYRHRDKEIDMCRKCLGTNRPNRKQIGKERKANTRG